jgi:DNA-binding Lrp family transcriptional regulator
MWLVPFSESVESRRIVELDALDGRLLQLLCENGRASVLELSRTLGVARATVSTRMERLQAASVITGYGPRIELAAAGFPVQALVTLEIAQGGLDEVVALLTSLPGVLEAFVTTGSGDVFCKIAAASTADLQSLLLEMNRSDSISRSTSVIVLSVVVASRAMPLPPRHRAGHPRRPRP